MNSLLFDYKIYILLAVIQCINLNFLLLSLFCCSSKLLHDYFIKQYFLAFLKAFAFGTMDQRTEQKVQALLNDLNDIRKVKQKFTDWEQTKMCNAHYAYFNRGIVV